MRIEYKSKEKERCQTIMEQINAPLFNGQPLIPEKKWSMTRFEVSLLSRWRVKSFLTLSCCETLSIRLDLLFSTYCLVCKICFLLSSLYVSFMLFMHQQIPKVNDTISWKVAKDYDFTAGSGMKIKLWQKKSPKTSGIVSASLIISLLCEKLLVEQVR